MKSFRAVLTPFVLGTMVLLFYNNTLLFSPLFPLSPLFPSTPLFHLSPLSPLFHCVTHGHVTGVTPYCVLFCFYFTHITNLVHVNIFQKSILKPFHQAYNFIMCCTYCFIVSHHRWVKMLKCMRNVWISH